MKIRVGIGCGCLTLIALFILIAGLFMFVYKTSTDYGECVGFGQTKNSAVVYEPNVGNIIIGIVAIETLVIPAYITLTSLECPVAMK